MLNLDEVDLGLFGLWPEAVGQRVFAAAGRVVLEIKSAEEPTAAERYCRLLNDLTLEMRAQFELFRNLRQSADGLIGGEDEAAAKLARADAKAASDAMSLIVRTLEKVDSLQRQLARDRQDELERGGDGESYEQTRTRLLVLIERRAEERAEALYRARCAALERDGLGCLGPGGAGPGPPGAPGRAEAATEPRAAPEAETG
ncbi:hypothetical protein HGO38_23895 [Rhizobium sp. CG5]|uniref:hypothetical protein n=1 Tax=Rhizobium sp. CG5 TaxID=2726076 RepID=UPI0020334740|nr:hypothetical protein [Rhizobium sp. CG5]MCM2476492.1 hypothetical protein [Rhizobium sp. CG5]